MAPWPLGPEPHLVQKLRWLAEGSLYKPLDIFDLFFHATPALLALLKAVAYLLPNTAGKRDDTADS